MAHPGRLILFLAGAGLATYGIALGAITQRETFLGADEIQAARSAAGTLVVLTGMVVGLGVALAGVALSRAPWLRTTGATLIFGLCTWVLVILVQLDYPNYDAVVELRTAHLVQSTLLLEGSGAPTVLMPLLALGLALVAGIGWAGRTMLRSGDGPRPSLDSLHRSHVAATALAVPFLFITVAGAIRVLFSIPADESRAALAFVVLPLAAAAGLALAGVLLTRSWSLAGLLRNPRLAPVARESGRLLDRVEWAAFGVLLFAALLSTALPRIDTEATGIGRTLVFTLESHGQGLAFAVVAMAPALRIHGALRRRLRSPDAEQQAPSLRGVRLSTAVSAALGAAALALALVSVFSPRGLLPWAAVLLPAAIFAGVRLRPLQAAPIQILAAWVCWALGNTVVASYNGFAFPVLSHQTSPAVLALWRVAASGLAGWAIFRLASHAGRSERRVVRIPLAMAAAIGLPLIALLEMPLAAWTQPGTPVDQVAVGSALQAQEPAVQAVIHILAALLAAGSATALARLLRPDWFRRARSQATTVALPTAG